MAAAAISTLPHARQNSWSLKNSPAWREQTDARSGMAGRDAAISDLRNLLDRLVGLGGAVIVGFHALAGEDRPAPDADPIGLGAPPVSPDRCWVGPAPRPPTRTLWAPPRPPNPPPA